MNGEPSVLRRLWNISRREVGIFFHRPMYLFCMLTAPLLTLLFFTTLMYEGLPTELPAGIVDEDNTNISRTIVRTLDSFEETDLKYSYPNFTEARKAMQRGEIYAFFHIPSGTTSDALASRQPKVAFYTNESYLVPGTLLMKDLRYASELSGLALTRETLFAKGATERQAMGVIQPLVIETHPLGNPHLNYSVALSNIVIPGVLMLMIFLTTAYTIGIEWKHESQHTWLKMAGDSPALALAGKLFPQTLLFCLMFVLMDICLYHFMGFPCKCGLMPMILLGILSVLASQAFTVFLFGIFSGQMRVAMCLCSLWGILSFSLAGFTYPVTGMSQGLQMMASLFPLRHYYLIYVNQALNGYSITYAWSSVSALLCFMLLPLLVLHRYRKAFDSLKYKP